MSQERATGISNVESSSGQLHPPPSTFELPLRAFRQRLGLRIILAKFRFSFAKGGSNTPNNDGTTPASDEREPAQEFPSTSSTSQPFLRPGRSCRKPTSLDSIVEYGGNKPIIVAVALLLAVFLIAGAFFFFESLHLHLNFDQATEKALTGSFKIGASDFDAKPSALLRTHRNRPGSGLKAHVNAFRTRPVKRKAPRKHTTTRFHRSTTFEAGKKIAVEGGSRGSSAFPETFSPVHAINDTAAYEVNLTHLDTANVD